MWNKIRSGSEKEVLALWNNIKGCGTKYEVLHGKYEVERIEYLEPNSPYNFVQK